MSDALVEEIAKAMAFARVGDPTAKDINNSPRWKWFVEDAEKYIRLHPNAFSVVQSHSESGQG